MLTFCDGFVKDDMERQILLNILVVEPCIETTETGRVIAPVYSQ